MEPIYLDHAATSPMHPLVVESMVEVMNDTFGNPSSIHSFGRKSRHLVDEARSIAARSIGAQENEIVFTSGGTEADNLAIIGAARANATRGKHIITTTVEHHAVLHACEQLEREGFTVTYLPVNDNGIISITDLKKALTNETILVTIMYGNNEVGSIQPIHEIGELLKDHPAYFHTDAVQAFGLVNIDVQDLKIDFLSMSGHKINGPKGVGFLYARAGISFLPQTFGGEQERKRRAGTENVPGIVGLAKAIQLSMKESEEKQKQFESFKQEMTRIWNEEELSFTINGSESHSLPHVLNVHFPGTNVESMLVNLDLAGISVSSGSACTAGSIDPSHVLVAMFGSDSEKIASSIRFSFGYGNDMEQIQKAAKETAKIVKRLYNKKVGGNIGRKSK
ncbi:cysteine desulfurase family protein [Sutcliffiella sp. NC1]|uniref:cysteine desulfurase family protein n=1 Tax=Sutcliffiella sp. NC1 TaxID=3004096 RepID=UPI0022DD3389|nr:cysteine desulfurase family protein [Sutcliffiella sp. NC1]WBL13938.1 cysteine desulfurase family protein [Sutcliffiella sp. NC1]